MSHIEFHRRRQSPHSLLKTISPALLTEDECRAIGEKILGMVTTGGETLVTVEATTEGALRWGRNEVSSTVDTSNHQVSITRLVRGRAATSKVNRMDDVSLQECIANAEHLATVQEEDPDPAGFYNPQHYLQPLIYSLASESLDAPARSAVAAPLVRTIANEHLSSAGYTSVRGSSVCIMNNRGLFAFHRETSTDYSLSVRTSDGSASGWAGLSSFDWTRIAPDNLTQRALAKCKTSMNPKAMEPGRYSVILEPQAVADLMYPLVRTLDRRFSEMGFTPWAGKEPRTTKLGSKVLDERITIDADPMDAEGGFCPFMPDGAPVKKTAWIDRGVLVNLSYNLGYARQYLASEEALPNTYNFRMSGGDTSLDEMIASTERALLVTRFHDVQMVHPRSALCTGSTRDGLWLIENGKIKTPVKNFRFMDSPLFAFNSVDQLGAPERVYHARNAVVVPPVKLRDFNFIALTDAI